MFTPLIGYRRNTSSNLTFNLLLISSLLISPASQAQWSRMGSAFLGSAAEDQLGTSVSISLDGSRIAIAAPLEDANGPNAGKVQVYEWDGNTWQPLGAALLGGQTGESFGSRLKLSGNGERLVVGGDLIPGTLAGLYLQVYEWDGSAWQALGPRIGGHTNFDRITGGIEFDEQGQRLVVGNEQYSNLSIGDFSIGVVRVYEWNGSSWSSLGSSILGQREGDKLGNAVSISADGNRIAMGSNRNSDVAYRSGQVRVFEWDGSDWAQMGGDLEGKFEYYGAGNWVHLSPDGEYLAVGNDTYIFQDSYRGSIDVFHWEDGEWKARGETIMSPGNSGAYGNFVQLSENANRLIMSGNDNFIEPSANAFLYGEDYFIQVLEWNGTDWENLGGRIYARGDEAMLGHSSIDFNRDGTRFVSGGQINQEAGYFAGKAWAFEYVPNCDAPQNPISNIQLGTPASSTLSLQSFDPPADGADAYLIMIHEEDNFTLPAPDEIPDVNLNWQDQGAQVVYYGPSTEPNITLYNLDADKYYLRIFAYNDCNGDNQYQSPGVLVPLDQDGDGLDIRRDCDDNDPGILECPGVELPIIYFTTPAAHPSLQRLTDWNHNPDILQLSFTGLGKIAMNPNTDWIYWVEEGSLIRSAQRNGYPKQDRVYLENKEVLDIEIDPSHEQLYWIEYDPAVFGYRIRRGDLNGRNPETVFSAGSGKISALALDVDQGKIYWVQPGSNRIRRANLDGTSPQNLATVNLSSTGGLSLALDPVNERLYWAEDDRIRGVDLDGNNPNDLIIGLSAVRSLAFHPGENKMYWFDSGTGFIHRANPDGSQSETVWNMGSTQVQDLLWGSTQNRWYWSQRDATQTENNRLMRAEAGGLNPEILVQSELSQSGGIFLDEENDYLYWVDTQEAQIKRSDLNGTQTETLLASGLSRPQDLYVHSPQNKIYWLDAGTDKIQRANLDGSNVEDLISTGLNEPRALSLDPNQEKLYWLDAGTHKIQRANLDGTDLEDLITTELLDPQDILVYPGGNTLYWSDAGNNTLKSANLNGTNVKTLVNGGIQGTLSLALDVERQKLYWTGLYPDGRGLVQSVNLDGTQVEEVRFFENLAAPRHLALGGDLGISLPVYLMNFSAQRENPEQVALSWQVLGPGRARGFSLQYSSDGQNFEGLHYFDYQVARERVQSYAYTHSNPKEGYYRVQLWEDEERFSFSPLIWVEGAESSEARWKIWPNPLIDEIHLQYTGSPETLVQWELSDIQGYLLFNGYGKTQVIEQELRQKQTKLSSGVYLLRLMSQGLEVQVIRLVVP